MTTNAAYDVVILGGGLAGLTLAIQLKRARPETQILVIEKNNHPLPEAAVKVGESTVEVGAYYFRDTAGLAKHLDADELPKLGLRFFYSAGDNSDITQRIELGPSAFIDVATHQVDRGRFENALGDEVRGLGIDFWDASRVELVSLGGEQHTVALVRNGNDVTIQGRWVVDASGRAAILKRQLGLAKTNDHNVGAAWFRIGERIDVNDWSDDPDWKARVPSGERWLSTIHFMGKGYWVWLIPLASGSHSVGIVADSASFAFDEINTFDRAMAWLAAHEPQCARVIEAKRDHLQDFRVLKHYSHSCERVYSPERWCITGEAGVFLDPFYSLGSDFIANSNGFITELITTDLGGGDAELIGDMAEAFNALYLERFEISLIAFQGKYSVWGNAQVMTAKTVWDFTIYWGVLALLDFHHKWSDFEFFTSISDDLDHFDQLNRRVQAFFKEWSELEVREWRDAFIDYEAIGFLTELHEGVIVHLDDDALKAQIHENIALCEAIAQEYLRKAARLVGGLPEGTPINPYVMSLKRERWQDDGLFSDKDNLQANIHYDVARDISRIWYDQVKTA